MPVNNQGYYMPGFGGVPPASSSYYDHGVRTSNYAPGPVDVIVVSGALGVSLSGATFSLSGTQSVQGFVTATFAGVSQPVNVTSPITATFGGQAQPVTVSGTILVASSVSASVWENSSSFVGSNYSVVFGPIDFSLWKNLALTVINNSPNNIQSASIEWSPNNN